MSEKRNKRADTWSSIVSFIPIVGSSYSKGIQQANLAKRQKEEADKIKLNDPTYTESPFAREMLDTARNRMGARMPGALPMQQGLLNTQANSFAAMSRAAANPQQLIAGAGALQQNTNSALNQLAMQEAQYTDMMFNNLNSALDVMRQEGDKVYGDQLRKFNRDFELKQTLLNSAEQNKMAAREAPNNAQNQIMQTASQVFSTMAGMPSFGGGGGGTSFNMPSLQMQAAPAARPVNLNPGGFSSQVPMTSQFGQQGFQFPQLINFNRR